MKFIVVSVVRTFGTDGAQISGVLAAFVGFDPEEASAIHADSLFAFLVGFWVVVKACPTSQIAAEAVAYPPHALPCFSHVLRR